MKFKIKHIILGVFLSLDIHAFPFSRKKIITHVKLSCYQPIRKQCNSQPLITADGTKINLRHLKSGKIKYCAISRDLLYLFPKNNPKIINIKGYGIYEVRDVMNKRFTHSVDILIHPKNSFRVLKNNVEIEIL